VVEFVREEVEVVVVEAVESEGFSRHAVSQCSRATRSASLHPPGVDSIIFVN